MRPFVRLTDRLCNVHTNALQTQSQFLYHLFIFYLKYDAAVLHGGQICSCSKLTNINDKSKFFQFYWPNSLDFRSKFYVELSMHRNFTCGGGGKRCNPNFAELF